MGNICRSPTAEGVLRSKLAKAGLLDEVELDSAGTHDYHIGRAPDARAQRYALSRGYDLSAQRARQAAGADFSHFDLILAMDLANLQGLRAICPPEYRDRVQLLMRYASRHEAKEVPDPYYGEGDGFERVLDYVEDACDGVVALVRTHLAGPR